MRSDQVTLLPSLVLMVSTNSSNTVQVPTLVTVPSFSKLMESCQLLKVKMVGIGLNMEFKGTTGKLGKNGPSMLTSMSLSCHLHKSLGPGLMLQLLLSSSNRSKDFLMDIITSCSDGSTPPKTTIQFCWILTLCWLLSAGWKDSTSTLSTNSSLKA